MDARLRHPFTDELKHRRDVERISVTRANRDALPEQLAERLPAADVTASSG